MGPRGENLLRLVLRAGTVFYCQDRDLTSPEPHYFVVLNHAPLRDEYLILCVTSSRVEKVTARCASYPGTAVLIQPTENEILRKDSAVNCNELFMRDWRALAAQLERKEATICGQLPEALLARLRAGVCASPIVENEIKKLLAG